VLQYSPGPCRRDPIPFPPFHPRMFCSCPNKEYSLLGWSGRTESPRNPFLRTQLMSSLLCVMPVSGRVSDHILVVFPVHSSCPLSPFGADSLWYSSLKQAWVWYISPSHTPCRLVTIDLWSSMVPPYSPLPPSFTRHGPTGDSHPISFGHSSNEREHPYLSNRTLPLYLTGKLALHQVQL